MKNNKSKTKLSRIAAATGGILVISLLFVGISGIVGDPVTKAIAKKILRKISRSVFRSKLLPLPLLNETIFSPTPHRLIQAPALTLISLF